MGFTRLCEKFTIVVPNDTDQKYVKPDSRDF